VDFVILAGAIWTIVSVLAGLVFVLVYLSMCGLQTITKRLYMGLILCYVMRNIFYSLVWIPLIYQNKFLCLVSGTGVFTSTMGEISYMIVIIVTLLIAKTRTRRVSSEGTQSCNPFLLRWYQFELWMHLLVLLMAAGYGFACAWFLGDTGDECYITSLWARLVLEVIISLAQLVFCAILLGVLWGLSTCCIRTENILEDKRPSAGCYGCANAMPIHFTKEVAVITLVFLAEVIKYVFTYMIFLLPIMQDLFYFVYFIAQNFPAWVLLCFYVLFNCTFWRSLRAGNCCCTPPSHAERKPYKGESISDPASIPLHVLRAYE